MMKHLNFRTMHVLDSQMAISIDLKFSATLDGQTDCFNWTLISFSEPLRDSAAEAVFQFADYLISFDGIVVSFQILAIEELVIPLLQNRKFKF